MDTKEIDKALHKLMNLTGDNDLSPLEKIKTLQKYNSTAEIEKEIKKIEDANDIDKVVETLEKELKRNVTGIFFWHLILV